jgi:hypothetical protein
LLEQRVLVAELVQDSLVQQQVVLLLQLLRFSFASKQAWL